MEQSIISNPNPRLLQNRDKSMKKLQDFVLKLAQAPPNAALAPPIETLLRDRLDHFVSHYRTPDHPPYSAMIQNALQELNEKGGSTKKSISKYLEKRYDNLPFAHSLFLKHHLVKTYESGEIVATRATKYLLAGSLNLSTKVESKPRKKRKWRLECDRQKHYQHKFRFIRERKKHRGKKVEAIRKYKKREEKEQPLTENGEDQTKSLLPCVDGGLIVHSNPTILQNEKKYPEEVSTQLENDTSEIAKSDILEHQEREQSEHEQLEVSTPERPPGLLSCVDGGLSVHRNPTILQNEKKYIEEVSTQLENDTSEIAKSNISEHHEKEQSEHNQLEVSSPKRPPGLLSCVDGGLSVHSNPTILQNEKKYIEEVSTQLENDTSEIANSDILEHQEREQSKQEQVEVSTPERPPGFESVIVENLYQLSSIEPEPASAGEVTAELVTPPKDGEFDSLQSECNIETPTNQEQALDLIPITLKQMRHEKQFIEEDVVEVAVSVSNSAELRRNGRRGWSRNNKLKKSLLQNEHVSEPSLASKEPESALSTEQEPQEKQAIFQGKQLRRNLRARPRVAKDANTEEHGPVTVCRRQDTVLKQRPTKAKRDESQGSSKSQKKRKTLEQKPDVENQKAEDSPKPKNISKQKARKKHRSPVRRSTRLQIQI